MASRSLRATVRDDQGQSTTRTTTLTVTDPGPPPDRIVTGDFPFGFTVPAGEVWAVADGDLTTSGSIIVHGTLTNLLNGIRTACHIKFVGVDESQFVGGPEFLPLTDIGIWVRPGGNVDVRGIPKKSWGYGLKNHNTWQNPDEVVVSPTLPGDFASLGFQRYVPNSFLPTWIDGTPAATFNLTRSVSIEGTPTGRPHIHIQSDNPNQHLDYLEISYLGPSRINNGINNGVLGRYPIHFHECGDGSRGASVRGTVVKHSGQHAFVAHHSNGVRFYWDIAYDIEADPYWWDLRTASQDVLYDHCVAAHVHHQPRDPNRFRLSGFLLTLGEGGMVRGCLAVGILGEVDSSGYHWIERDPKDEAVEGVWGFEDNQSRNCRRHGIFTWQNTDRRHFIATKGKFIAVNCGASGVRHGAYTNMYEYLNLEIWNPPTAHGFVAHALAGNRASRVDGYSHTIEDSIIHGGLSAVRLIAHVRTGGQVRAKPVLFRNVVMLGQSVAKVTVNELEPDETNPVAGEYDFVGCTKEDGIGLEPGDVKIEAALAGMRIRAENGGIAWRMDDKRAVTAIEPFYPPVKS